MLLRAVIVCALFAAVASFQAAPSQEPSRGIAADGRVVASPQGVPPPWGHDIIHLENPHYPESLRAKHPVASGFFRLMFDVPTGHVRKVVVERSSGYPAADANIIQRWQSSHGLHRRESSSVRAKRFQKRWDASPSPPTSTSGIPLMSRFCVFRQGRLPIRIIRTAHSGSSIM